MDLEKWLKSVIRLQWCEDGRSGIESVIDYMLFSCSAVMVGGLGEVV